MPPSAWRKVEQGSGAVARLISSTGSMARGSRVARGARRAKQSCGDGGMTKLELGHDGSIRACCVFVAFVLFVDSSTALFRLNRINAVWLGIYRRGAEDAEAAPGAGTRWRVRR